MPSPSKCLLKAIPSLVARSSLASALLRLSSGAAKALSVERDQIESAQHGGMVAKPITERIEYARSSTTIASPSIRQLLTGRLSTAATTFG